MSEQPPLHKVPADILENQKNHKKPVDLAEIETTKTSYNPLAGSTRETSEVLSHDRPQSEIIPITTPDIANLQDREEEHDTETFTSWDQEVGYDHDHSDTLQGKIKSEIHKIEQRMGLKRPNAFFDTEVTEDEIRKVIDPLYKEKLDAALQDKSGFIDRDKDIYHSDANLNLADKVKLTALKQALRLKGIEEAGDIAKIFYGHRSISFKDDITEFTSKEIVDNLKDLTAEEVRTGREMMEQLGYSFHPGYFSNKEFAADIRILAGIDQQVIHEISKELNQYCYLRKTPGQIMDSDTDTLRGEFKTIMQIAAQGGLTSEQKDILDDGLKLALLDTLSPFYMNENDFPDDDRISRQADISTVLSHPIPKRIRKEVLRLVENRIYQKITSRNESQLASYDPSVASWEIKNLAAFDQQMTLDKMEMLRDFGFDLYDNVTSSHFDISKKASQDLVNYANRLITLMQDPDKFAWIALINTQITYRYDRNQRGQSLSNADILERYELLYEQKETIEDIIFIANAIPWDPIEPLIDVIGFGSSLDGKEEVIFNTEWLADLIDRIRKLDPDEEVLVSERGIMNAFQVFKKYAVIYKDEGRRGSPDMDLESLAFGRFIIENWQSLDELFTDNDSPTPKMMDIVLNGQFKGNKSLVSKFVKLHSINVAEFDSSLLISSIQYVQPKDYPDIVDKITEEMIGKIEDVAIRDRLTILKGAPPSLAWIYNSYYDPTYFHNGKPTREFYQELIADAADMPLRLILETDPANISSVFNPQEQTLLENWNKIPSQGALRYIVMQQIPNFPFIEEHDTSSFNASLEYLTAIVNAPQGASTIYARYYDAAFYSDGKPTRELFNHMIQDVDLRSLRDLRSLSPQIIEDYFSSEEQEAIRFITEERDYEICTFLAEHFSLFDQLIREGEKTPELYRLLARESPHLFVPRADKTVWRQVFGEEEVNNFLNILPKQTDEKRNAFTHNEYDRTSKFIQNLIGNLTEDFRLTENDFKALTEYVEQYGLARSPVLFRYFKYLYFYEHQLVSTLPEDIRDSGIVSTKDLNDRFEELGKGVYGDQPMTELSNLSDFEIQILDTIVGKSTHTFHGNGRSINQMVSEFSQSIKNNDIASLKEAYKPETISISQVELQFDPEPIRSQFQTLSTEIRASIKDPNNAQGIIQGFEEILQAKIEMIENAKAGNEGGKLAFMEREQARFRECLSDMHEILTVDEFVSTVVDMKIDKTEKPAVDSLLRRAIFQKIFQKSFSREMINNLQGKLEGEITPAALLSVVNIIDHVAKGHVLSMQTNNADEYWEPEVLDRLKASKNGRRLVDIFSPFSSEIREVVDAFTTLQKGNSSVQIIPDRGFVGEMSGYIGNACYTAEYPLLKQYPNMTPYKFVLNEGDQERLIGSVLVFEVTDVQGNPSLLVRAMDLPDEQIIDVREFIEQFLDKLEIVAQSRGIKQILVPGSRGTISNYEMTNSYVLEAYVRDKTPISLSEKFSFNRHDLTDSCYIAREVEQRGEPAYADVS